MIKYLNSQKGDVLELVYLWVEDYKNIQKQGFNFSPRFDCKFYDEYEKDENGKEKLKVDCRLEIKPKEHIENFFGENINVTAIVGKNGSGKSSLLELINKMSYENPLISPYPISSLELEKITIYYDKVKNKLYIYKNKNKIIIDNQSSVNDEVQTDKFIQKILIPSTPSHNQKEYLLLLNFLIKNNIYFPFDIPKIINFGIHDDYSDLLELIESSKFDFHMYYSAFEENEKKRLKIFHILLLLAYLKNYQIDFDIEASKNHDDIILELENKMNEEIINKIKKFIEVIKNNLEKFSKNPSHYMDIENIPKDFFKTYIELIKRKTKEELLDFKGKNVFNFNLYPQMSDGQYQLTYLYNMIYSQVEKKNILLLIDEGENYLHPNWQKKYISYIVQFIKDNFSNRKIHIILTSHSPFLLSDIPKQNIIFLDKDEKGNCKVVDGLKEKKQTFGANIHTLLSDSFFMEEGLMGEFAKGKIDDVINYLHGKESKIRDNDEAQKLIHIIGEPIVKNQLQRMLDSKRLQKIDEIYAIKQSMEAMQKRLDELDR